MASFTDSPIQNFNPYISQLPVEAMVSVGQQKQQQYNEGVQRIQGQIDQVAGMDVVRDVDKQYLQSKLNNLGSDLKKVAAGDFSNYQLVNSVGGLASKIGKDTNVQSAVASTARYRKGVSDMDSAIKEGKSSPSNEYVFQKEASKWLGSTDIKESYNGGYTPYSDWKKSALELLRAATKDSTLTEDAFTVDENGHMTLADAVVKKSYAGISPGRIQEMMMAGLSPADFKQMQIDGVYSYANLDAPTFQKSIDLSHKSTISFYEKQIKTLEAAKLATTSVSEKSKLDDQILALTGTIATSTREHNDLTKSIKDGDLDNAKAQYYTKNSLDSFSKAFSFTETSQVYAKSELAEAARWRETKNFEMQKFKMTFEQTAQIHEDNMRVKAKELQLKEQEGSIANGGLLSPVVDAEKVSLGTIYNETTRNKEIVTAADEAFMKRKGHAGDLSWLNQQKESFERSSKGVEPEVAQHFISTSKMRSSVDANEVMLGNLAAEADAEYGTLNDIIPNESVSVWNPNTNNYEDYSAKDFVDFNTIKGNYIKYSQSGGTIGARTKVEYDDEKAKKELSPKQFHIYEALKNQKTQEDLGLKEQVAHYDKEINTPYKKILEEKTKFMQDRLNDRVSTSQGGTYSFPSGNAVQKEKLANNLNLFANFAEEHSKGIAESPNWDLEKARALALDKDAHYSIKVVESNSRNPQSKYEVTVSGKEGTISFNVTPEQKRQMYADAYEPLPEVAAIRPYQEQITRMGGYTTNLAKNGDSNHDSAYLKKIDFPSVSLYGVTGDITKVGEDSNAKPLYSVKINVFNPVKGIWVESISTMGSNVISETGLNKALLSLDDTRIFQLLNERNPTAQELKELEQASKKPL